MLISKDVKSVNSPYLVLNCSVDTLLSFKPQYIIFLKKVEGCTATTLCWSEKINVCFQPTLSNHSCSEGDSLIKARSLKSITIYMNLRVIVKSKFTRGPGRSDTCHINGSVGNNSQKNQI